MSEQKKLDLRLSELKSLETRVLLGEKNPSTKILNTLIYFKDETLCYYFGLESGQIKEFKSDNKKLTQEIEAFFRSIFPAIYTDDKVMINGSFKK